MSYEPVAAQRPDLYKVSTAAIWRSGRDEGGPSCPI